VAGDGLDELHIGAGRDEARDGCVPEVVESVALSLETSEPQRRYQTRCRKFDGWSGVPRIDPKTSSSGA
jgi:hypothetical protein